MAATGRMVETAVQPTYIPMSMIEEQTPRPLWTAIRRGLRLRCPSCGEGRSLYAYVKVHDACPACGEELHHHRADDMPPYVTILVVGHLVVPLMLMSEMRWAPETWVHWITWIPATIALSLFMLPRVKGAVVGLQWAHRMHGFGGEEDTPVVAEPWNG